MEKHREVSNKHFNQMMKPMNERLLEIVKSNGKEKYVDEGDKFILFRYNGYSFSISNENDFEHLSIGTKALVTKGNIEHFRQASEEVSLSNGFEHDVPRKENGSTMYHITFPMSDLSITENLLNNMINEIQKVETFVQTENPNYNYIGL